MIIVAINTTVFFMRTANKPFAYFHRCARAFFILLLIDGVRVCVCVFFMFAFLFLKNFLLLLLTENARSASMRICLFSFGCAVRRTQTHLFYIPIVIEWLYDMLFVIFAFRLKFFKVSHRIIDCNTTENV